MHGQAFTDRDRVMMCQGQASASTAAIVPLRKNADSRPLAGSSRSTKGLMHRAARRLLLRSAIRCHEGNHPVRPFSPKPCERERRDATAGRESAESCRRPEILGTAAAAGERAAIRIFRRGGYWPHGERLPMHSIHLIAIGKSRPWREGCEPDRRTSQRRSSRAAGLPEDPASGSDVTPRLDANRPSRAGGQRSLAQRRLPARGRPSAFSAGEDVGPTARSSPRHRST